LLGFVKDFRTADWDNIVVQPREAYQKSLEFIQKNTYNTSMKFKLVFFDCDGVLLIEAIPWKRLHRAAGLSEEQDEKWFNEYYSGKISYKQWVKNVEEIYIKNGMNRSLFKKTLSLHEINPEIYSLLDFLEKRKIKTAIISSGIDEYVKPVARELGIELCRTNYSFDFDKNGKLKKINYLNSDKKSKVIQIKEICRKFKIKPTETLFIGDSINDLEAFKLTKHGVLYKNDFEGYKKFAWKTIKNLGEIKKFL